MKHNSFSEYSFQLFIKNQNYKTEPKYVAAYNSKLPSSYGRYCAFVMFTGPQPTTLITINPEERNQVSYTVES